MQVDDSPTAARAGLGIKDELRAGGEEVVDRARPRSGGGFRGALERRLRDARGSHDLASAAALAGWFRSEVVAKAGPAVPPTRLSGVSAAGTVDRILLGSGPDGAQARIRIGGGALAGTEIRLCSLGRLVEAQLLTHAATSRQTLSVVLDEIRGRLRDRGIVLSARTHLRSTAPVREREIAGRSGLADQPADEPTRGRR
jgi:hypothetical protein